MRYDAVLFDLDGVLTDTAALHAACWKQTFDEVLDEPFDAERDYLAHVDGKPREDGVLEAARRLGVTPERAVVVEDALAGVAAGRAGGFGLVIGVDRGAAPRALHAAGADVVVCDLGELA